MHDCVVRAGQNFGIVTDNSSSHGGSGAATVVVIANELGHEGLEWGHPRHGADF
jgi:hypothetical protein